VDDMDEFMVQEWNRVVKPEHKVYHLGDVAMSWKHIATIGRCNGHKRLLRGNHDIHPMKKYLPYFEEIAATRVFEDMILSHIPLHPESLKRFWTNCHGHIHNNQPEGIYGPKYLNMCVEVTEYRPQTIEEVRQRIKAQQERFEGAVSNG
jgi:calcineurin-like phosphoesterase family protein